jgi:hypothetical protein
LHTVTGFQVYQAITKIKYFKTLNAATRVIAEYLTRNRPPFIITAKDI